jgi:uncharacterized damage-inducible protein DinB
MPDLRYPIGRWTAPERLDPVTIRESIGALASLPAEIASAVAGLDPAGLERSYREGGWTVRQLVHHVADSHLNAYCRHRLAVLENRPTIRPYDERAWAELEDARRAPVAVSLTLLAALHDRWTTFLAALPAAAFEREFLHPEWPDAPWTLGASVHHYAWHGRHHTAHILAARRSGGAEES